MAHLLELFILFLVIFDPLASFAVFLAATRELPPARRRAIALEAVGLAAGISLAVLIFGEHLLILFQVTLDDFRVASGLLLAILGLKMTLGESLTPVERGNQPERAIAAIIATPLLTGPAAITAIIVCLHDYGRAATGTAVALVMGLTALLFIIGGHLQRFLPQVVVQVLSTFLGLVTIAWGVRFVRTGLGF